MVTKLLLFLAVHGGLTKLSQRTPLGCGEATGAEQLLAPITTAASNGMNRDMSCNPLPMPGWGSVHIMLACWILPRGHLQVGGAARANPTGICCHLDHLEPVQCSSGDNPALQQ